MGITATFLVLPGVAACSHVLNAADGLWADVLDRGFVAFLVWQSVPVTFVIGASMWKTKRPVMLLPLLACGFSLVATAVALHSSAPDGSEYDQDLSEGLAALQAETMAVLDEVVEGRYGARPESVWEPTPCTDAFGRAKGAAYVGLDFDVTNGFTPEELDLLGAALERRGWDARQETMNLGGGPARRLVADRSGYKIRTWGTRLDPPTNQPEEIEAWTPCLRE